MGDDTASAVKNDVLAWLREQHPWLQEAAFLLLSKRSVSDDDINTLLGVMEKSTGQQQSEGPREFPDLVDPASREELRLLSIGDVQGIESLAPHQPLTFGNGNLAVVFGTNGSGKSGYIRILKKACGKPPLQPLKPDLFKELPEGQSCAISYRLGAAQKNPTTATWDAGDAIPALTAVDIFDSMSGRFYLTSETTAAYVPPLVALFEDMVRVCDRVAANLDRRKRELPSRLPTLPPQFAQTAAGKTYLDLTAAKKPPDASRILRWSEDDARALTQLDERLGPNSARDLALKKRKRATAIARLVSDLTGAMATVSGEPATRIATLIAEAAATRTAATEGAQVLASSSLLAGVGAGTWRALWLAARSYSEHVAYPDAAFPKIDGGARCVLCQQELSHEAKARLRSFEAHVRGTLEEAASLAEKARDDALAKLPSRPNDQDLAITCEAASLDDSRWLTEISATWDAVACQVDRVRRAGHGDPSQLPAPYDLPVLRDLTVVSANLEREAAQHDADAAGFDRVAATAARLELQCRQWTSQQAAAVKSELARREDVARLERLRSLTNHGPISRKAGLVAAKLITDEYVGRFNSELSALAGHRAQQLRVELVKTRVEDGRAHHRIQLSGIKPVAGNTIEQVLSEGESRVVSLAAFLADSTATDRRTPFIFDDPISSLDHDFEWAVARRLAKLALTRQVIVFTHRLSLYGFLEDAAKKNGDKWDEKHLCRCCIERMGNATGRPVSGDIWTKDTAAANSVLMTRLAAAKERFWDAGDSQSYRDAAKGICSDFRKLLERTVENDLLNKVILRHRRSVTTDNRIGRLASITPEDCAFLDSLMTKYSFFEHSHSEETPVEVPDEPSLRADLESLMKWRQDFKKRAT